jgi:hypothetical protein
MKRLRLREISHRYPWLLAALLGLCAIILLIRTTPTEPVDSFAACAQAGYPITDSYPPVCQMGLRYFTGPLATPLPSFEPQVSQPIQLLVDADSQGGYPRGWQLIQTQTEWTTYWADVHANIALPPLIPVDFNTSDVVALSVGSMPTAGHRVDISNIVTSRLGTIVNIRETTPVGCNEAAHPSNPYLIVRTSKLAEPVSYVVTPAVHQCGVTSSVQSH